MSRSKPGVLCARRGQRAGALVPARLVAPPPLNLPRWPRLCVLGRFPRLLAPLIILLPSLHLLAFLRHRMRARELASDPRVSDLAASGAGGGRRGALSLRSFALLAVQCSQAAAAAAVTVGSGGARGSRAGAAAQRMNHAARPPIARVEGVQGDGGVVEVLRNSVEKRPLRAVEARCSPLAVCEEH